MAIKGSITKQGMTAPTGYAYIDGIHGNKDGWSYHYSLHFAPPTRDAAGKVTDRGFQIEHRTLSTPRVAGEDPFVTCYEAMKSEPEFTDFIDAQ